MRIFLFGFPLLLFTSCRTAQELPTVDQLDLNAYMGTWYEIARFPHRFERELQCVSATYMLLEDGRVSVHNRGYATDKKEFKEIRGTAWVPDAAHPGQLKVCFFWPFSGDYYVLALHPEYSYALVGDPSREYLWILAREKTLNETILQALIQEAENLGFDTQRLERVSHACPE